MRWRPAFDADLALLISPGDVITLSGRPRAGKTAAARAMIRYPRQRRRARSSKPDLHACAAYDLPPFRWFMRISTASAILRSWKRSACRIARGHVVLIEWPSAHQALPRTESTSRFVRRWYRRPAPLKSPAMESGRSSRKLKALRQFLNEAATPTQPAAHGRRRVERSYARWSATMASSS